MTGRLSPSEEAPSVRQPRSWLQDGAQGKTSEELIDEIRRAMERNPETTRAAVLQLIALLEQPAATGTRGGLAPWQKRKVDRFLREHLDRPVRLKTVAEQVSLSVSHFSRAFKESFGTTPHMHIVRLRVELARQLMLTTEDSLSQIAYACGLADQAHLSKLFRRMVGETPNVWRRRNFTDAHVAEKASRATGFVSHGIAASY